MESDRKPIGRLRSAWGVLRGQRITPLQMQADFTAMIVAFDSIFDKLNTSLARLAKREQSRAEETAARLALDENGTPGGGPVDKAALWRRWMESQAARPVLHAPVGSPISPRAPIEPQQGESDP